MLYVMVVLKSVFLGVSLLVTVLGASPVNNTHGAYTTTRKPLIFANAVTLEEDGSIEIQLLAVYGRSTRIQDVSPNAIVVEVSSTEEERNTALRYYMAAVLDYWLPIEVCKDERNIGKTLRLTPGEGAKSVEEVQKRIQAAYYYAEDRANAPFPDSQSLESDDD